MDFCFKRDRGNSHSRRQTWSVNAGTEQDKNIGAPDGKLAFGQGKTAQITELDTGGSELRKLLRDWRQRLLAWALAHMLRKYERAVAERKRWLFSGVLGTVVEIGPGAGANLPYFSGQHSVDWHRAKPVYGQISLRASELSTLPPRKELGYGEYKVG